MVDAAVQARDDGFAVLRHDEGTAFGQLADLFGAQDGDVVAGEAAAARLAGLPAAAADAGGAEEVGDLLVERDVLGPAEHDEDVGQAQQGACLLLTEQVGQLGAGLGGVDERQTQSAFVGHPGPQGRDRRGRGQLVEAAQQRGAQATALG